jgi:hypothetical protein
MGTSRSFRNNNPGNLRFSTFTEERGAVNDGENYAKFPDLPRGLAAMVTLLAQSGYRYLSIGDAINRYAPGSDRNFPAKYTKFVCNKAELSPMRKIVELNPFEYLQMISAMIEFEGWKD